MDEPKQSWWNYLADHPKTAGATALIALAVSFSPKASVAACWLLIAASWIIAAAAISGTPVIKKSKNSMLWKAALSGFLAVSLFVFGKWLTNSKDITPITVILPLLVQAIRTNEGNKYTLIANSRNNTGSILKVRFSRGFSLVQKPNNYGDRTKIEDEEWAAAEAQLNLYGHDQDLPSRNNGELNLRLDSRLLTDQEVQKIGEGSLIPYFFSITQDRETKEHLVEICVYLDRNLSVQDCSKHNKP